MKCFRLDFAHLRLPSFLPGWGGIFAVMLMRRLGRLPILFWSQVLTFSLECKDTD